MNILNDWQIGLVAAECGGCFFWCWNNIDKKETVHLEMFAHVLILLALQSEIKMEMNICFVLNYSSILLRWVQIQWVQKNHQKNQ